MKCRYFNSVLFGFLAVATLVMAGCSKPASEGTDSANQGSEASKNEGGEHAHVDGDPSHGGWWCVEHGVPEEQCAMCNTKLAAEHREKGDWCEEHNRPDSLCFICHPEKAEKYAALYEAKFGEQPPKPTE